MIEIAISAVLAVVISLVVGLVFGMPPLAIWIGAVVGFVIIHVVSLYVFEAFRNSDD